MRAVHIVSVEPKQTLRGTLYRIRDDEGTRYSTYDMWAATLCLRAKETGVWVRLLSSSGWYDRSLLKVELEEQVAS